MKRYIALFLAVLMFSAAFAGCGKVTPPETTTTPQTESTAATESSTTPKITETTTTETTTTTEKITTETTTTTAVEPPVDPFKDKLVAFWDFDSVEGGIVRDSVGGHDGKIFGKPEIAEGKTGSAISFNTLGQHIVVDDSDDLDFGKTDSFTFEILFKWDGTFPDNWVCVMQKGLIMSHNSYKYYGFWIDNRSSTPNLGISNSTATGTRNLASADTADTEWHKYTGVQNGEMGKISFYIDGVLQKEAESINAVSAEPLYIGINGNAGNQGQFFGMIDYIKIYSAAVVPAVEEEPVTEYTYEKEDGLLAYWAFDTLSDGTVRDVTGNGHDGVITGNPKINSGYIYKGLKFGSIGDGVVVEDAEDLNFTEKDSFTIEVYYKWNGTTAGSNWPCLFHKGLLISEKAYNYVGLWLGGSGNQRKLALGITGNGGTGINNLTANIVTDTKWHMGVIIQDAEKDEIALYLDGVKQCVGKAINCSSEGRSLYIGNNGEDGQFIGTLDEIKVYNYAKDSSGYEQTLAGVDAMSFEEFTYTDSATGEKVTLPYRLYLPKDYSNAAAGTYPVLLFLHGYGECGTDNTQQIRVLGGANGLLDQVVEAGNCVIIAPQCPADPASKNWVPINKQWGTGSRVLTDKPTITLAAATALFNKYLKDEQIDKNRVYVSGISMGGYGTWEILARNPELFAAAIPVCGAGIPSKAGELKNVAIWAFHGEADGTVPVSGTKDMISAIKAAGGTKAKVTYFPGVGHSCWPQAFSTAGLVEWLFLQSK